jgi:FKBP-type peptidyl-prolyl cis-trans isomerase
MKTKKKSIIKKGRTKKMAKTLNLHKNRGIFTQEEVIHLLDKADVKYELIDTDDDIHEKVKAEAEAKIKAEAKAKADKEKADKEKK